MKAGEIIADRYRLEGLLGEGGFGQTWRGADLLRGESPCAIKLLTESSAKKGLHKEFKLLRSLYHPHIVEVLDYGSGKRALYLVTEFIDGAPLNQAAKKLKGKALWELLAQLCRALSYLHSQQVIHGDLKPDNILVDHKGDHLKLIDFGLAQIAGSKQKQEAPAGTLAYLAPEVLKGKPASKQSDLYALGILLYQLLAGRLPFPDQTEAMISFHLEGTPSYTFLVNHPWRVTLEAWLKKLLAKDPTRRPSDPLELIAALNKAHGLKLPVHRAAVAGEEEKIFFETIEDYLQKTQPLLELSAVQSPHSFLAAEAEQIEKYLQVAKGLSKGEGAQYVDRLREAQIRLLIQQGRYPEALKVQGTSPALQNVRALAMIYQEKFSSAQTILEKIQQKAPTPLDRARAANYLGFSLYNQGKFTEAKPWFERSLKEMKRCHDTTGTVSSTMNLGAIAQQQGEVAQALKHYREALAQVQNLKNSFLLAILLSNLANLLLQVGSLEEARDYLEKSQALATELRLVMVIGYNRLLQSDLAMWEEETAAADRYLEEAVEHYKKQAALPFLALTGLKYAENAFYSHQWGLLPERLRKMALLVKKEGWPDTKFRYEILKVVGQVMQPPVPKTLPASLVRLGKEATQEKQRFRVGLVKALWALQRQDTSVAAEAISALETLYQQEQERLPIASRNRLAEAPLYRMFWEMKERLRHAQESPADQSLWHLIEINKRIAAQRETGSLYEVILDAAIELTGAERGFLILDGTQKSKRRSWEVKAARRFRQRELPDAGDRLSQNITQKIFSKAKPLLIQNALEEEKLSRFRSVRELKLRSILAVPILVHGDLLGALYVDHTDTANLFGKRELELLQAFADQAGIALTQARLYEESLQRQKKLEEAQQQLAAANEQLSVELEETSEWAERIEGELKKVQEAGSLIVRSEAMKRVVRQLPQWAERRRPIVLSGEPGTGKGLLARVLHQQTDRAPFVTRLAIQLPRQRTGTEEARALLESFDQARGGTLYIDELSELPIPYQRDLLAMLKAQETQDEPAVFAIVSSRLSLKECREKELILPELDSFLSPLEVSVPPLRKRKEEIRPLIKYFLEQFATEQGKKRQISRRALGLLHEYDWPGNIRELRLELERAVMATQVSIGPTHLSPNLLEAVGFVPGAPKKTEPNLQDQRAQFERDIILQALEQTGWNKVRAAKQLGLSRAMLYIKLEKYQIPLR